MMSAMRVGLAVVQPLELVVRFAPLNAKAPLTRASETAKQPSTSIVRMRIRSPPPKLDLNVLTWLGSAWIRSLGDRARLFPRREMRSDHALDLRGARAALQASDWTPLFHEHERGDVGHLEPVGPLG